MNRIRGLDSIRFLCAVVVALMHINPPPLFGYPERGLLHVIDSIYHALFNGPAAVIVFFVISGFCIHYPHRHGSPILLKSYYTRRLTRICLPLVGAMVLVALLNRWEGGYAIAGVWSIICEIVYYLIYPGLVVLERKWSWKPLIGVAYLAAVAVTLTQPAAGNYNSFGYGLNWIVGLPVWLLGCQLARHADTLTGVPRTRVWLLRAALIGGALVVTAVRFHLPGFSIGNPWSLNVYALLVYLWVGAEISHFRVHAPVRWLEAVGVWTYSLYLLHGPISHLIGQQVGRRHLPDLVNSLIIVVGTGVCAFVFYQFVERPSHLLAVSLSNRAKGKTATIS